MTLTILTLIMVTINCLITVFSFVGYSCSKKRKQKLKELEQERLAKVETLKKEIEKCNKLINNDTTPLNVVELTQSLKNNLEQQLEMLTVKK